MATERREMTDGQKKLWVRPLRRHETRPRCGKRGRRGARSRGRARLFARGGRRHDGRHLMACAFVESYAELIAAAKANAHARWHGLLVGTSAEAVCDLVVAARAALPDWFVPFMDRGLRSAAGATIHIGIVASQRDLARLKGCRFDVICGLAQDLRPEAACLVGPLFERACDGCGVITRSCEAQSEERYYCSLSCVGRDRAAAAPA